MQNGLKQKEDKVGEIKEDITVLEVIRAQTGFIEAKRKKNNNILKRHSQGKTNSAFDNNSECQRLKMT